jgi:hypothetical protein
VALKRYTGLSPMRVSRDAKYSVTVDDHIRLAYWYGRREKVLFTTADHLGLGRLVNDVKRTLHDGKAGGAFYLNEYGDVLVPDGEGGPCYWAGHYDELLVFKDAELTVSPVAPSGLEPGEVWPGPHVGIPYVLEAGANDVRYEVRSGNRIRIEKLSDHVGSAAAGRLGKRISQVKTTSGGRFYINERMELFTPLSTGGAVEYIYVGCLDEDAWFPPPDGFDRP